MARRTALPPISWLMQTALTRPKLISLAAGFTDNATLPVEISRKLLNEILRSPKTGQPALQYGITAGEMNLRTLTAKHLQKLDGGHDRAHSPERVIITGGSQQLLYMTLEALCDEGDIILVEDPTYFVFLSILQSRGIQARGVKLERDGIDLLHLEKVLERLKKSGELRRVKALYLVTYFQNPTGATTSLAKKSATLKLLKKFERAAGHPIYLLEDAAYRELRFDHGEDVPTALTLPGATRARDLHRHLQQALRAWRTRRLRHFAGGPIFTVVQRIKGNHDFGTANLLQQLLADALASGLYDKHVAKVRKNYARKARVMKLGARGTFSGERGNLGIRRRTLFLGATAGENFRRREIKSISIGAEERRALCSRRTLLRRRSVAHQAGQRNAHQFWQRERGKHPQRNRAIGQGVEEIYLIWGAGRRGE